ncbi:MAG: cupredoxin domain-containing protein [Chloroflexi bacterium]|nr:cupredoxin domain-containing protein [Chloroflexota bacterium]
MATLFDGLKGLASRKLDRRGVLAGLVGTSAVALAACGGIAQSKASAGAANEQQVYLTVMGSIKMGPDGKMHDAFTPADFSVVQNRPVKVTVYSYDDAPHSITAPALKLNQVIAPRKTKGTPAVTTFTFTPTQTGKFLWNCDLPCDGDANGWAMQNPGYMSGYITVTPA